MFIGLLATFFAVMGLNLMLDLKPWKEDWKQQTGAIMLGGIAGITVGIIYQLYL